MHNIGLATVSSKETLPFSVLNIASGIVSSKEKLRVKFFPLSVLDAGSAIVSSKKQMRVKFLLFSMLNKFFWFSMLNIGRALARELPSKKKLRVKFFPLAVLDAGSAIVSGKEKMQVKLFPFSILNKPRHSKLTRITKNSSAHAHERDTPSSRKEVRTHEKN